MNQPDPEVLSVELHVSVDSERIAYALSYYRYLIRLGEFVQCRWHEPFTLEEAADAIGLSPSRLSHLFSEKTGVAFRDWVRYERVRRAAAILRAEQKSIGEVAFSVGFRNSRTFERSFQRMYGVSPSSYRKHCEAQLVSRT